MAGNWIHRLFNPHCPSCHDEMICNSCELLKGQLEVANHEKNRLLDRLLEKPAVDIPAPPMEVTRPHNIPWAVRRQMLESEDREKARLMREAPVAKISTEDLEKELDIASATREATS